MRALLTFWLSLQWHSGNSCTCGHNVWSTDNNCRWCIIINCRSYDMLYILYILIIDIIYYKYNTVYIIYINICIYVYIYMYICIYNIYIYIYIYTCEIHYNTYFFTKKFAFLYRSFINKETIRICFQND